MKSEMDTLPLSVFVSDVDKTLTNYTPPGPFLGHGMSPSEATSPLSKFTQKLVRTLLESEVPGMLVTKNTPEALQSFLDWSKARLDPDWEDLTQSVDDKLPAYRQILKSIPEEALLIFAEDATTLIPQIILLDPRRVIAISALEYTLPQQMTQFLESDDPQEITSDSWIEFLTHKWKSWNSTPWIALKDVLNRIPDSNLKVGFKYFTISQGQKKLFRISRSTLDIFTPTGTTSRGNLMDENTLWGFRVSE